MFTIIKHLASSALSSPLLWGISYFVCLVVFAGIYKEFDPEGFYHTTVKYEAEAKEKEQQVSRIIAQSILRANKDKYDGVILGIPLNRVYGNKVIIDGETAYFKTRFDLIADRETISFVLPFSFEKDDLNNYYKHNNICTINAHIYSEKKDQFPLHVIHKDELKYALQNPPIYMTMSCEHGEIIKNYFDTINGFPDNKNNSYWRMLYFSAVTITTLGYGDIVPISDTNRNLVTLESILGIIIIGLFLNALADKSKRRQGKQA